MNSFILLFLLFIHRYQSAIVYLALQYFCLQLISHNLDFPLLSQILMKGEHIFLTEPYEQFIGLKISLEASNFFLFQI